MGGTGTRCWGPEGTIAKDERDLGVILRSAVRSLEMRVSAWPEQKNVSRQRDLQATISQVGL